MFYYRKPMSPCYGCEDRTAECHATCEKHKAWEEQNSAEYKKMRKAYEEDVATSAYEYNSIIRTKKRKRAK